MKLKSNEPFWLVKNGTPYTYPSLRKDLQTDILIIGAGITGSLIAHRCMSLGFKTVLMDRRDVCNGSTSATTSMLQYEVDTQLQDLIELIGKDGAVKSYKACSDAIDQLEKLCKEIKSTCGFKKKQSLYYAAWKKDVEKLEKEYGTRRSNGFAVKWCSANEIKNTFGIDDSYGGILSKQGASMDAYTFAQDLIQYNAKRGLEVYDKTDVSKVNYKSTGITAKTEHGNTIRAKKIIYCNGFESVEIIKDKFVDLLSTYAIVSEKIDHISQELNQTLIWNTANPYLYMRTTDDNRILIGGEDEEFVDAKKRDELLNKKADKLEKQFQKLMPKVPFHTDYSWAGTFGSTKDGLPYIGAHPNFPSAYFVLGFGGNGITFSVSGMDMVESWLRKEEHPLAEYFKFRR